MNKRKFTIFINNNLKVGMLLIILGCASAPRNYDKIAFQNAIIDKGAVIVGQKKWQRCSAGMEAQKCSGEAIPMNLISANEYCKSLKLDGGGWKLPENNELIELVKCESGFLPKESGCGDPKIQPEKEPTAKIDQILFPNSKKDKYWTRSIGKEMDPESTYDNITFLYFFIFLDFKEGKREVSKLQHNSKESLLQMVQYENPSFLEQAYVRCVKNL
jgi:hypothetical protein